MRLLAGIVVLLAAPMNAQQTHPMETLRRAGLSVSEGPVRMLYSPGVKEPALRSQIVLQEANAWFEQQLGRRVSMTLAVLDAKTLAKVSPLPMASSWFEPNLVLFPADIQSLMPQVYAGNDRAPAAETALFHESGHIFANEISIQGGGFINELVPNVFAAAYIRAVRPELAFVLDGAPTGMKPRYTSWEDLLYLRETVGLENYLWFQMELQGLADWCVRTYGFAQAVEAFHKAFPGGRSYQVPIDGTIVKAEAVLPGFAKAASRVPANSGMRRLSAGPCGKSESGGPQSILVVRNDTNEAIDLAFPERTVRVDAGAWRRLGTSRGTVVRLSGGKCLVVAEEPGFAVLTK